MKTSLKNRLKKIEDGHDPEAGLYVIKIRHEDSEAGRQNEAIGNYCKDKGVEIGKNDMIIFIHLFAEPNQGSRER